MVTVNDVHILSCSVYSLRGTAPPPQSWFLRHCYEKGIGWSYLYFFASLSFVWTKNPLLVLFGDMCSTTSYMYDLIAESGQIHTPIFTRWQRSSGLGDSHQPSEESEVYSLILNGLVSFSWLYLFFLCHFFLLLFILCWDVGGWLRSKDTYNIASAVNYQWRGARRFRNTALYTSVTWREQTCTLPVHLFVLM